MYHMRKIDWKIVIIMCTTLERVMNSIQVTYTLPISVFRCFQDHF